MAYFLHPIIIYNSHVIANFCSLRSFQLKFKISSVCIAKVIEEKNGNKKV